MKQANRTDQARTARPGRTGKGHSVRHGRHEISRFLRRFLVLVLIILMAAASFAGYAALYPTSFTLPTPVFAHENSGGVAYWVLLKPNNFTGQTELGMDQVYLRDFADTVRAVFYYRLQSANASAIQYSYRIDATLRVHDQDNPDLILLTRVISLVPETVGETSGSTLDFSSQIDLKLADYEKLAAGFENHSSQPATFDMLVTMSVQTVSALPFGAYAAADSTSLLVPLNQPRFTLTRIIPEPLPAVQLMPVTYRLVLADLPFAVYPVMAGICFLLLVFLLSTTRSRRKNRYERRLRRLLRMARSQLMIIGDKAWEPEWCVTAADFRSMVRTAKKLKHPIFCYIDKAAPIRVAYFYIYYGENNYCYTFSDGPVTAQISSPADDDFLPDFGDSDETAGPSESDDRIPLLPETDDSPEIMLANLRVQSGTMLP